MKFLHRFYYTALYRKGLLSLVLAGLVSIGMLIPKSAGAFAFNEANKVYYAYSDGTPWDGFSGSFALDSPSNPNPGEYHYTSPDFPQLTLNVYNYGATVSMTYPPINENWNGGTSKNHGELSSVADLYNYPYPPAQNQNYGAFAVRNASVSLGGKVCYFLTTPDTITSYSMSCKYLTGPYASHPTYYTPTFTIRAPFTNEGADVIFETTWYNVYTRMYFGANNLTLDFPGAIHEQWDGEPWKATVGPPFMHLGDTVGYWIYEGGQWINKGLVKYSFQVFIGS